MPETAMLGGSQVVAALGLTLVDFLWQGALLAAAYALAVGLLRSSHWARLRLAIGHLTLLGFTLAPVLTFNYRLSALTPMPSMAVGAIPSGDPMLAVVNSAGAATLGAPAHALLPWLVAAWLVCVLLLAVRGLMRWQRIRQVCFRASPLPGPWLTRVDQLHRRLGVRIRVRVLQSVQVATPILVGWLRPTILLPIGLCARLSVQQVELVLAHELAHVRRLDAWANALQSALETVLFYHPAVHWVGRRIRNDREMACDQWVAQAGIDRFDYARALLALAEEHRDRSLTGLAMAATGGALLARIEAVLETPPASVRTRRLEGQMPAAILAALIMLMAGVMAMSDREDGDARRLVPLAASQISIARLAPTLELLVGDLRSSSAIMPATWSIEGPVVSTQRPGPSLEIATTGVGSGAAAALASLAIDRAVPVVDVALALPELVAQQVRPLVTAPLVTGDAFPADAASLPAALTRMAPDYPRAALLRGAEGAVSLSFAVDSAGRPVGVEVVGAADPALAGAATEALLQWRFPVGSYDGSRYQQSFAFELTGSSVEEECRPLTGTRLCRTSEPTGSALISAETRGLRVLKRR